MKTTLKSPHRYYHCSSRSNNIYKGETKLPLSSCSLAIACAYRRRYTIGAAYIQDNRNSMSSEIYPEDLYRMKSTPKITELSERSCLVQSLTSSPHSFEKCIRRPFLLWNPLHQLNKVNRYLQLCFVVNLSSCYFLNASGRTRTLTARINHQFSYLSFI